MHTKKNGESDGDGEGNSATVPDRWESSEQPSMAIVGAVAELSNRTETELPPLQQTIDAEALDRLLTGDQSSLTVSFRYADHTISASADGTFEIQPDTAHADESQQ